MSTFPHGICPHCKQKLFGAGSPDGKIRYGGHDESCIYQNGRTDAFKKKDKTLLISMIIAIPLIVVFGGISIVCHFWEDCL